MNLPMVISNFIAKEIILILCAAWMNSAQDLLEKCLALIACLDRISAARSPSLMSCKKVCIVHSRLIRSSMSLRNIG